MTSPTKPAWSRATVAIFAATALLSSSLAAANPAVITRSAEARSAPFNVAPVIGNVVAGESVSADEQATNGWRRVQLGNGKAGFVPEDAVKVAPSPSKAAAPKPATGSAAPEESATPGGAPADAAPAEAAPAAGPVQPLAAPARAGGPQLYVGDFSHLAELVKSDSQVFDVADGIATRDSASSVFIWGGVFGGLLLRVLAETALRNEVCVSPGMYCSKVTDVRLEGIGTAMILLGPLVGWAIRPTRADQTRVLNQWNTRHPDRPFVDRAGVEVP